MPMKSLVLALTVTACTGIHGDPDKQPDAQQSDAPPLVVTEHTLRAGGHHNCLVKHDGTVWCWGRNQYGELGVAASVSTGGPPVQSAFTDAIAVSPGNQSTCGVKSDHTVWCWGRIIDGSFHDTPVKLMGDGFVDISLSENGLCGRRTDGSVACWMSLTTPPIQAVATSEQATWQCAVDAAGSVTCWGDNTYGQLGDGTVTGNGPVQVAGLTTAVEVSGFASSNCARLGDGTVSCWGYNVTGELGVSPTTTVCPYASNMWPCRPTAAPVPTLSNVAEIAVGDGFAAALLGDGTVRAWGDNGAGQLGTTTGGCGSPFESACSAMPVTVQVVHDVTQVAAGGGQACACQRDGALYCWGAEFGGTAITLVPGLTCD
jgi:alpha-tubulin suppressor-like RCC1 family protein